MLKLQNLPDKLFFLQGFPNCSQTYEGLGVVELSPSQPSAKLPNPIKLQTHSMKFVVARDRSA